MIHSQILKTLVNEENIFHCRIIEKGYDNSEFRNSLTYSLCRNSETCHHLTIQNIAFLQIFVAMTFYVVFISIKFDMYMKSAGIKIQGDKQKL